MARSKQAAFHGRRLSSVGDTNLILRGDLMFAAEDIRGETLNRAVIAIGGAHRLTGLCQTRHLENLRQWLERNVKDGLGRRVVKGTIVRDDLERDDVGVVAIRTGGEGVGNLCVRLREP